MFAKHSLLELEDAFSNKFIEALEKDIKSSRHSCEINNDVLRATTYFLQHRDLCPHLNLEQIIKGTLNMVVALQDYKYQTISPSGVGEDKYQKYRNRSNHWLMRYNETLKELLSKGVDYKEIWNLAIPVIKRAANSPLYVTPYASFTLEVYFEYLKAQDENFTPPNIPMSLKLMN